MKVINCKPCGLDVNCIFMHICLLKNVLYFLIHPVLLILEYLFASFLGSKEITLLGGICFVECFCFQNNDNNNNNNNNKYRDIYKIN